MLKQSIEVKKAEIKFRSKLVKRHLGEKTGLSGEYDFEVLMDVMQGRVSKSRKDFDALQDRKVTLSPFLEIGAERCQRSMALENIYNAQGFAVDISKEMLEFADVVLRPLSFEKMPFRVCCDAHNLPFQNSSFPFVFCYDSLHHFPYPIPILLEAKRVIRNNGFFFMGNEPIKRMLKLKFWTIGHSRNRIKKILDGFHLLGFLVESGKGERKFGVLEEKFSVKDWEGFLKVFEDSEIFIKTSKKPIMNWKDIKPSILRKAYINLLGGQIKGLLRISKPENFEENKKFDLYDFLACPDCIDKPKLARSESGQCFICSKCGREYKVNKGILTLLSEKEERLLYSNK